MIQVNTVLVLGAGASNRYGFPTGSELVDRICDLAPTYVINRPGWQEHGWTDYYHDSFEPKKLEELQSALRVAKPSSIEIFLADNPKLSMVGRAAMATVLMKCENEDKLLNVQQNEDWYNYLRIRMGEHIPEFLASAQKLSIITFNYDRSLEYYFYRRLEANHHGLGLDLYKKLNIVHIYGKLGIPDFEDIEGFKRPYTSYPNKAQVSDCISAINIIANEKESSVEFKKTYGMLFEAKVICFLGFGYNETNIERLQLPHYAPKEVQIFGSVKNITQPELENDAKHRFKGKFHDSDIDISSKLEFKSAESGIYDYLRNAGILTLRD